MSKRILSEMEEDAAYAREVAAKENYARGVADERARVVADLRRWARASTAAAG